MSRPELSPALVLNHGLTFAELFTPEGLQKIDGLFLLRLRERDARAHDSLVAWRAGKETLTPLQVSELLLACGPVLDDFIAHLFNIQDVLEATRRGTLAHDPVFHFKKLFVQRRARRRLLKKEEFEGFAELDAWLTQTLKQAGLDATDRELAIAKYGERLLLDDKANAEPIEKLTRWCLRALTVPEGKAAVKGWASFRLPEGIDYQRLVPIVPLNDTIGRVAGPAEHLRPRDGFRLTDPRMGAREVQNEIHYCIYCHDHDGDFCSKGFPEKKGEPDKGLKVNPLGVTLTGCPLDEKISEMHSLKKSGHTIGALAMITVDNPMCAATGHRICNDCMKACIYQKQDPVNIPQTETRILTDVLDLPWGVEIYDLLIRWNPLRPQQWLPKPYNSLKVLVFGMGPAGFTLAHHMLMEGFAVVGAEGLKIEPLPDALVREPIRDFTTLEESLDTRIMAGFGGVAEYGITNRWDKNFLKLIYLSLARRPHFQVFGGVRFGGTLTVEDAWHLGFDHIAICIGAGLPQALPIPGSLAPGMRQANDFLMALQLTGAAKHSSLANLQVRLPAVVIGGGLTGVDTATEIQAYYIVQVEKMLERYETLSKAKGEAAVRAGLDAASLKILDEFLAHGRAVRAERERARKAGAAPDFLKLIRQWGGVTIAYRKGMNQSPAYTRNHEEIIKAFEEGIYYAEGLDPKEARVDADGQVEALVAKRLRPDENGKWLDTGEEVVIPTRAILVATGARPNVAYEFEHKNTSSRSAVTTRPTTPCSAAWSRSRSRRIARPATSAHSRPTPARGAAREFSRRYAPGVPRQRGQGRRLRIAYLSQDRGDTRRPCEPEGRCQGIPSIPRAHRGNPGRARGVGAASHALGGGAQGTRADGGATLQGRAVLPLAEFRDAVGAGGRHAPANRGARHDRRARRPGHGHGVAHGDRARRELAPGGGAQAGRAGGAHGPDRRARDDSGWRRDHSLRRRPPRRGACAIHRKALREKHNRVLFVGCFDSAQDIFCQDEIEAAADTVLWITSGGAPVKPRRPQDRAVTAPVLDALVQYAAGKLGDIPIKLEEVTRMLVVGSNRLVRLIRDGRKKELQPYLTQHPATTGSINTPMQCCLKGVCSQCLQWQIDPHTGKRTKAVFSCSWQDQPLDIVDLDNLDERLSQNRVQEHLTNQWLDYLLTQHKVERV
jgi:NADPH-dependent glutamate synthase beta subunit-like oxidoreductase